MRKYITPLLFFLFAYVHGQEIEETSTKIWTLQECIDYAIKNNITIIDAELSQNAAKIDYEQSRSQRLPDLFGNASQSFSNGNSIDPITSDYVSEQIHSTSVNLSTSVTLFQGGQITNQIKQNKLIVDQNSFYIKEARNNIILSITQDYLQARYNQEAILIAQSNLDATNKEVDRAKARYDAGSIAKKDYTDAVSQAATNKYNLLAAQKDYELQILELKQLLELNPETSFEIEKTSYQDKDISIIENKLVVYEKALDTMPEIASSKINIAVYEKDLDIAKGAFLPTLSLNGSIGTGYSNLQDGNYGDQFDLNLNQNVNLSLSVPIFNRNSAKNQVKTAKINIEKAQLDLKTSEKALFKKIETAWQNAVASNEQLVAAKAASEAAKDSYTLAQKQYELGSLSTTDLVVSQNTYTNARQNYIQTKYLSILYAQLLQFYQGNDIKI
ncbi:MAG: TolC family protein [Leeuwenhoekiella sp.]